MDFGEDWLDADDEEAAENKYLPSEIGIEETEYEPRQAGEPVSAPGRRGPPRPCLGNREGGARGTEAGDTGNRSKNGRSSNPPLLIAT